MKNLLKFLFAGFADSIRQRRANRLRENAARHNLELARYQAAIRKVQSW